MKPLRVDFIAPTGWRPVWGGIALLALAIVGCFAWKASELLTAIQTTTAEMARIQSETERLRKLLVPKVTPRTTSASKAVTLLQFDVNKVFSAMENVDVAGTRITGVTLDMASGALGLEYVLEHSTQAQAITDALNGGYETRPWRMERLSGTSGGALPTVNTFSAPAAQPKTNHGGLWRVDIARL